MDATNEDNDDDMEIEQMSTEPTIITDEKPESDTKDTETENSNKQQRFEDDWSSGSESTCTSPVPTVESKPVKSHIDEHRDEILEKILEKPPENPAPVKIVISKKKGSIFKSRVPDGTKKGRALYRHKWSDDKDAQKNQETSNAEPSASTTFDEFGFQDDPLTRISAIDDEMDNGVTSVKCTTNDKGVCKKIF